MHNAANDDKAKSQKRFKRTFTKTSRGAKATADEGDEGDEDDEENWIFLTDDDDKRIRAVHKENPSFSRYELQRVFAAVKENGGSLGREEFAMVFVTYSKMHDHSMALGVFDLLDVNGDNEVSFEGQLAEKQCNGSYPKEGVGGEKGAEGKGRKRREGGGGGGHSRTPENPTQATNSRLLTESASAGLVPALCMIFTMAD